MTFPESPRTDEENDSSATTTRDEIDEILREVEQVAISTLDLPYTSTYVMDYLAKKSKRPRFGNLEDIQEVLSQESHSSLY